MALADLDAYRAAVRTPHQVVPSTKWPAVSLVVTRPHDLWLPGYPAQSTPSTAVVPASTTGLNQYSTASALRCVAAELGQNGGSGAMGTLVLCDRLSHQGGLSGTTTGAQTTNLPTAALTRYTDGAGVMAAFSIYSTVGITTTTVTASYTDQSGNSGHASPVVTFGGTNNRDQYRAIMMPLASGDSGVRSVESVTIAISTGTAGNFGVVLFKPLACFPGDVAQDQSHDIFSGMLGGLPEILDDACLFWMLWSTQTSSQSLAIGSLSLAED